MTDPLILGDELADAVADLLDALRFDSTLQVANTTLIFFTRTQDALNAYQKARAARDV